MSTRNGNRSQLRHLQDALFEQIYRLSDPDISEDKLKLEVARTKALTDVASRVVDVGRLSVDAWDAAARHGTVLKGKPLPLLTGPSDDAA